MILMMLMIFSLQNRSFAEGADACISLRLTLILSAIIIMFSHTKNVQKNCRTILESLYIDIITSNKQPDSHI